MTLDERSSLMTSMATRSVFSTLIHRDRIVSAASRLNRDLLEEALMLRERDQRGQHWSRKNYANGFTSYGSMDELQRFSSPFWQLKAKLDRHVKRYLTALDFKVSPKEVQLTKMWVNVMGQGCTHAFHLHPLSLVSGSYYVQMPKGCSAIKFEDPRLAQFMGRPPLKKESPYLAIQPQAGEVILFESWLKHEVPIHLSKTERISVSFNYDWIRS